MYYYYYKASRNAKIKPKALGECDKVVLQWDSLSDASESSPLPASSLLFILYFLYQVQDC